MAQTPLNSTPSFGGSSPSGRHDSVFVVENSDMDLGALFAGIEKKEAASSVQAPAAEAPAEPVPAPSKAAEPSAAVAPPKGKSSTKRALLVGFLGVIFAAATAVGTRHFLIKPSPATDAKNPVQVRRSIVVPNTVERLELFFPAQSKEKEELLLMTVTVHAGRPHAEDVLSSVRVALRDAVYGYLSRQHPEKNVRRSWAPIVEKELLAELQGRFPQAGIIAVQLEELQKI